jgi:hypothetical protein
MNEPGAILGLTVTGTCQTSGVNSQDGFVVGAGAALTHEE